MSQIIRVFGPDGAGKSTIVPSLQEEFDATVINCSQPATWPDTAWHEASDGQFAPGSPEYHIETLRQCYGMVGNLATSGTAETLVLDSDPQLTIAAKAHVLAKHPSTLEDMFAMLGKVKDGCLSPEVAEAAVHVTVAGETALRGQVLYDRILKRGSVSRNDPTDPEMASALASAYDSLETLLDSYQIPCTRVDTSVPRPVFRAKELSIRYGRRM